MEGQAKEGAWEGVQELVGGAAVSEVREVLGEGWEGGGEEAGLEAGEGAGGLAAKAKEVETGD